MSFRDGHLIIWLTCLGGIGFLTAITRAEDLKPFTDAERNHWAFQPIVQHPIPATEESRQSQSQNPIDSFIRARLRSSGLDLSVPADRQAIIRRVSFDVIGLPPSPEEVREFLDDTSPDAYERLVDRLLGNPHFGEAWGRIWLDVVRFAETAGFKDDPVRPNAFTYRDYVIRAFNRDAGFDRFIADQLAADEMFPDDAESVAATAFCRMWPDESNASNIRLARQTSLDDLTTNIGAAFLGLSIGCAQCHDHKFDPILQTDFYQLQAFFSGIVLEDRIPIGLQNDLLQFRRDETKWLGETRELRHELALLERPARIKMQGDRRMKFPEDVLEALDTPLEDRTTIQRQLAFWSARQMGVKEEEISKNLTEDAASRRDELLRLIAEAQSRKPKAQREATVMAVLELTADPPATYRMEGGSYDRPREVMLPNFPVILRSEKNQSDLEIQPLHERTSGRRSELAKWMASPNNQLTHRVWVNRIWQGHFGRGLVPNANDFGIQTTAPAYLELFDWLTSELIHGQYVSKRLHRLILSSATYRQSSTKKAEDGSAVTEYAQFGRQRLSSERIRDAWLRASGQLNDSMYGPGVRPELPPNFSSADWKVSEPAGQVRRSVYLFAKRNLPYPMMAAFDFPDMHEACGCRSQTTIAPQALMLLNDRIILQAARQLADRARSESSVNDEPALIQRLWQICFTRSATQSDMTKAIEFLEHQRQRIRGESSDPSSQSAIDDEAFVDLCHALLNTSEFLFVD